MYWAKTKFLGSCWLSGRKLNELLHQDHFYLELFRQAFFFSQWTSLSLVEALKISKGGNALKHLISSRGSWAEGRGVPQEAVLCGSIYTNNEILQYLLWPWILPSSQAPKGREIQLSLLTFDLNSLKSPGKSGKLKCRREVEGGQGSKNSDKGSKLIWFLSILVKWCFGLLGSEGFCFRFSGKCQILPYLALWTTSTN